MASFDDIGKKVVELTEQTLDKTQELADSAKSMLHIRQLESELKDMYCELGKYYYAKIQELDAESLDEQIAEYRLRIYQLEAEVADIKATKEK